MDDIFHVNGLQIIAHANDRQNPKRKLTLKEIESIMKGFFMERRQFLKAAGCLAGLGVSGVSFGKGKKQKRKPNVVFIITDDQKLDSFGFINKKAMTPNIDRIAKEGVYFSKGYASTSVCTPSRYTCLTGRYASRSQVGKFINGITDEGQTWVQWNADMAQSETNIPKVMKANGYVTGVVGKLHGFEVAGHNKKLNKKSDAHDPEVIKMLKEDQKIIAEDLKNHGFDYAARLHRANLGSTKSLPDEICKHAPEWTAEGALNFIEANKDKPFYLYYATTLLHGPNPLESLKSDPRISEEGFLKQPPKVMPSRQSVLDRVKKAGIDESLAPATWLDDSIGAILNKLDELDLTEDTLVIYFNDNAVEGGKGSLYEGGVSTPVMIRWPGKIKAGESEELVSNIDFAPTIFGACGITRPKGMKIDGIDLMPLLAGKTDKTRDSVFCEIGYTRAVVTKEYKYLAFRVPPSRQISREDNLKIMRAAAKKTPSKQRSLEVNPDGRVTHIHRTPGGDGTELGSGMKHYRKNYFDADQLYDIIKDPRETNNLANDPRYADVLKDLKAELKKHLDKVPGTFAEFKS